jgi:hypothetical protein
MAAELMDRLMSYRYCVITKCTSGDADVNELNVILLVMTTKT